MSPVDGRRRRQFVEFAALSVLASVASGVRGQALAPPPREAHGALDVYAGEGIVLAWAILRGKDEKTTTVIVRGVAEETRYGALSVTGVDPFTKDALLLASLAPIPGSFEVRAARERFADHPRTEWRFYRESAPARDAVPALLVYYQGIPDTSPEFDDAGKLDAYLAGRLQRARSGAKGATK
jgi:hypothetical protein